MSGEPKFTPGPWRVHPTAHTDEPAMILAPMTTAGAPVVADVGPRDERDENAALIAAAPDMYETLRETRALVAGGATSGFTDHVWMDRLFRNQAAITAALAKAEGREPSKEGA